MSKSLRPPRQGRRMGTGPGRKTTPIIALMVEPVSSPACFNCGGFPEARVRIGGELHTVTCPVCTGRREAVVVAR